MSEYRYHARILPDGHVPVPEGVGVRAGDEVEITLTPVAPANGAAAKERSRYVLSRWCGIARTGRTDVAERHDEHLYGESR